MPQRFVPFTETRNDKAKGMNLLLERAESPGSQRTAVILVSRGVTLLVCGFGQLIFVMPQFVFVPFSETRNGKTKWMNLLLEKVESSGSQRTAVILVLRLRGWSSLDLSVQRSFWFRLESRCWCVVLASWFSRCRKQLCHARKHGMIQPNGLILCLRGWSRLGISVKRSFWFHVESRCWCVVLASWVS